IVALAVAALAPAAHALTGKWEGSTRSGASVLLDLTATDKTPPGTLTHDGQVLPITDGKVSKNTISFKIDLGDKMEAMSGALAGEELRVWIDSRREESTAVLKRVKK